MANKFATKALTAVGVGATIKSFLDNTQRTSGNSSKANEFASLIKERGLSPTNRFDVELVIPQFRGLARFNNNVQPRMLQLMCHSASLPGVSLESASFKPYGVGMMENTVIGARVEPITLNFYCDATGVIQNFFYEWIDKIYGFSQKPQYTESFKYPNTVEYREKYETTLTLKTYNEIDDKIIVCQTYEAYPSSMGEISLSWQNRDDVCVLPIRFNYTTWSYATAENSQRPTTDNRNSSLLQQAVKAATAIQVIKSMKRPRTVQDVLSVTNNAKILIDNYK